MMVAANFATQRPATAKLLVIDAHGDIAHSPRSHLVDFLRPGDLLIANDAATMPASLHGMHLKTGATIEVRLAGRGSLDPDDIRDFSAIVFGAGDFHTRTEDRALPPALSIGDQLVFGPLSATVNAILGHPRLVSIGFEGTSDAFWAGLAAHGHPIQYAHVPTPLALWDVWTPFAAEPVAFEPPSAGFVLNWQTLAAIRARGIAFATITHAAGISSTGDDDLDRRLPFDEPYRIPAATALAIRRTKGAGGRVIAIGTTVVRALEHSASLDGRVHSGTGLATNRIGASTQLRVVDAIISGTHEPDTSHYQMLRAFTDDNILRRANCELENCGYRTHEFGDSVMIERAAAPADFELSVSQL